jgi:hypothetical protein
VGTLPIADAADLFIAINKGYFHRAGLTVTPDLVSGENRFLAAQLCIDDGNRAEQRY